MKNLLIACALSLGVLLANCSSKKEDGPLKDYKGRVTTITKQLLEVTDNTGRCITFDNRQTTFVGGVIMPGDSVNVSYKGKLDNGTVSIICEFIQKK